MAADGGPRKAPMRALPVLVRHAGARATGHVSRLRAVTVTVIEGDCRQVLATLPDASVHCVVTSPPYWGLRDYGTGTWEGGDAGCDHSPEQRGGRFASPVSDKQRSNTGSGTASARDCPCGARRIDQQIGLEPSLDAYVAEMVAVFREVRRVLRDDGTLWLNLGDAYVSHKPRGNATLSQSEGFGSYAAAFAGAQNAIDLRGKGHKDKDLMMIPARVALALQDDGWWLRSDIIWAKPNPMPESVTDRPTSAHEHVFLLTKAPRYFFDAEAVREAATGRTDTSSYPVHTPGQEGIVKTFGKDGLVGRNIRNVWEIATAPFPEAHFATFPPELAERCIKAGTSERGCCAACGAPWGRVTETAYRNPGNRTTNGPRSLEQRHETAGFAVRLEKDTATIGWRASCSCPEAPPVPCTVLDPFAGAGTTLLVADRLQRNGIGIELNPTYAAMARRRVFDDAPLLAAAQ